MVVDEDDDLKCIINNGPNPRQIPNICQEVIKSVPYKMGL